MFRLFVKEMLLIALGTLLSISFAISQEQGIVCFDLDEDLESDKIALMDVLPKGWKIVLLGEVHSVASSPLLAFNFLKLLHRHHQVKYFLAEGSPSDIYLFTEKPSLIDFGYEDDRYFWLKLKAYNDSLAQEDRIRIFGVDHEREDSFIEALQYIFQKHSKHTIPQELANVYQELQKVDYNKATLKQMRYFQRKMSLAFKKNSASFIDFFEEDSFYVQLMIEDKVRNIDSVRRDKRIFTNIQKIAYKYPNGNYFGVFGANHTNLMRSKNNIANLLKNKKSSAFYQKVMNINPHYKKCAIAYFHISHYKFKDKYWDFGILDEKELKQYDKVFYSLCKDNFTLIDVRKFDDKNRELFKYGDYILYIKNQEGFTAIE